MDSALVDKMVEMGIMKIRNLGYISQISFPNQPVHTFWIDNKGLLDDTVLLAATQAMSKIRNRRINDVMDQQCAHYETYKALFAFQLPPNHPIQTHAQMGVFRTRAEADMAMVEWKRAEQKKLETSDKITEAYEKIKPLVEMEGLFFEEDDDDDCIMLWGKNGGMPTECQRYFENEYMAMSSEQNYNNPKWLKVLNKSIKKLEAGEPVWKAMVPVFVYMNDPKNS